ncbi:MAG: PBP1A family penicillin-binding protein [Syntrophobacterales bacterium]
MENPISDRFPTRRRPVRRLMWIIFCLLFTVILAGVGTATYFYYSCIKDLPDFTAIRKYRPPVITSIYARDGRLLGEFYAERRIEVDYSRFPKHLILAFVAAEDARFFEHPGVDIFGIIRAFLKNWEAGRIVQGASTITQQMVNRILLKSSEDTYARKLRQAVLAYRIENYLTKKEILTLYLNQIFLGRGAYGVEAAAQEFFGKHVEDLTLAESALLAGLPPAPAPRYYSAVPTQKTKQRQAYVLTRMTEEGFISQKEATEALRQPIRLKSSRPGWIRECRCFTEHVLGLLEDCFGEEQVRKQGFKVYTTADVNLHLVALKAIAEGRDALLKRNGYLGPFNHLNKKGMAAFQERKSRFYKKYPPRKGILVAALVVQKDKNDQRVEIRFGEHLGVLVPLPAGPTSRKLSKVHLSSLRPGDVVLVRLSHQNHQKRWIATLASAPLVRGVLLSMELDTGKVRVMTGSEYFGDDKFKRAIETPRPPGSAFKPIVYATAVELLGYEPNSILLDVPLDVPLSLSGGRRGKLWDPKNYDHTVTGPMPLSMAMCRSRNIPTVRLMMLLGVSTVVKMAQNLGISSSLTPDYSSALGASEVTLLELIRAYSVFPNRGYLVDPIFINRIEDRDGRVIFKAKPRRRLVAKKETADIMTSLFLGAVQRGTATRVKALERPVGGMTGTTNKTKDAWFIGFTPSLITGVRVGMDNQHSLGPKETGSQAAAPIFVSYMREALKNQPVEYFPEGVKAPVGSGKPDLNQDAEEAIYEGEFFYPEKDTLTGGSPKRRSPKRRSPRRDLFKSDLEG